MKKSAMSTEDYLEAIVMLGGTPDSAVRSIDIARKVDVTKSAVNKAIGQLKENGYVDQPYYGDVTLTQKGYDYGKSVYRRHVYLTAFFTKTLGIPEERAEEEACLMEHAISDTSFEKWVTYIDNLGILEAE